MFSLLWNELLYLQREQLVFHRGNRVSAEAQNGQPKQQLHRSFSQKFCCHWFSKKEQKTVKWKRKQMCVRVFKLQIEFNHLHSDTVSTRTEHDLFYKSRICCSMFLLHRWSFNCSPSAFFFVYLMCAKYNSSTTPQPWLWNILRAWNIKYTPFIDHWSSWGRNIYFGKRRTCLHVFDLSSRSFFFLFTSKSISELKKEAQQRRAPLIHTSQSS